MNVEETACRLNVNTEKLGKLFFTLVYSHEKTALIVTIKKCTDLPAPGNNDKLR